MCVLLKLPLSIELNFDQFQMISMNLMRNETRSQDDMGRWPI